MITLCSLIFLWDYVELRNPSLEPFEVVHLHFMLHIIGSATSHGSIEILDTSSGHLVNFLSNIILFVFVNMELTLDKLSSVFHVEPMISWVATFLLALLGSLGDSQGDSLYDSLDSSLGGLLDFSLGGFLGFLLLFDSHLILANLLVVHPLLPRTELENFLLLEWLTEKGWRKLELWPILVPFGLVILVKFIECLLLLRIFFIDRYLGQRH